MKYLQVDIEVRAEELEPVVVVLAPVVLAVYCACK